jgi:hypothetical protein
MIDARQHTVLIANVLAHYHLPASSVEVVDDIQEWCRTNGADERNPWRAGRCWYRADGCQIVLRAEQTDSMISSSKSRMELLGFGPQLALLDTDEKYFVHLLLHEVAAYVLQTAEQATRDEWAFQQLPLHLKTST